VQSIERENIWKEREGQNDAVQWGVDVDSSTSSEEGWPGVPADALWRYPEDPLHTHGWPSVKGGVEVSIKVCSDALVSRREHSTCKCL
jgi:hypothetical protein